MYIVSELMRRLGSELEFEGELPPSDYFDLIGGSGIGAYVSSLYTYRVRVSDTNVKLL